MLKSMIWKSDPWDQDPCTRPKCRVCPQRIPLPGEKSAGPTISCRARSILYSNTCVDCWRSGSKFIYYGESSKSGAERVGEHYSQALSKTKAENERSHMWLHWRDTHGGEQSEFQYRILKKFRTPLANPWEDLKYTKIQSIKNKSALKILPMLKIKLLNIKWILLLLVLL